MPLISISLLRTETFLQFQSFPEENMSQSENNHQGQYIQVLRTQLGKSSVQKSITQAMDCAALLTLIT